MRDLSFVEFSKYLPTMLLSVVVNFFARLDRGAAEEITSAGS